MGRGGAGGARRSRTRFVGLIEDSGAGPVAVDTAPFIYLIEEHERFLPVVEPLFAAIDEERVAGVTSTLSLLETLVVPYRAGNVALAERYEEIFAGSRGLTLIEIDRRVLRAAAALRARTGMKTPDAVQVASALSARCSVFITNDRRLPPVPGLSILSLSDYG